MGNKVVALKKNVIVMSKEEVLAEYKRLSDERSALESQARKLKDQADVFKQQVLDMLNGRTEYRIGRFNIKSADRSRENVNIGDARSTLSPEALAEFENLVTVASWTELKVTIADEVGEILESMEKSNS